jgi:hypothetical protein
MTILLVSLIIVFGPAERSLIHINAAIVCICSWKAWMVVRESTRLPWGAGMSLEQLVMLSINTSVMLLVFGLSLQADS